MPDEPDDADAPPDRATDRATGRLHDTDPLADTLHSEDGVSSGGASAPSASSSSSISTGKRRSVRAGDTLGRYELIEDVGEGGMATVYRARDRELRREVAVKVLFPHLARREEVVRRFHREARAAAGLEHANILRVYDVGGASEGDDPPYIVMELIRGRSLLGEIEQRGPMLAEVAACIGALLADALAVAHKAGIIHRDIKPANVMIASDGRVLLADFGVARLETEDSLVTKTGALLGTPAYMSPEQASGDTATARSDLYSLGAALYQMTTGQLPYTGSPAKVLASIAQGALVSAVRKRASVGPELSRLIDRLMAADPVNRPASAAEVAAELRRFASASGFGDPADEATAYFADPDGFVAAKTPAIVKALVTQAEQAIADSKLPRAMALADRASALAPDDPAVVALVARVTEGDRSSRRNRVIALVGAGVLVAGGATFGAVTLLGGSERHAAVLADGPGLAILDAGGDSDATSVAAAPDRLDAGSPGEPPLTDAGLVARVADAGVRARDAGATAISPSRRDAGTTIVLAVDAGIPRPPVDAAVQVATVVPDAQPAALATGVIVVKNDTWCDVKIDDIPRGRNGAKLTVPAGPHTVRCEQPALGKSWTKQVDVAPGATLTVEGSLLGTIDVTLEVDATLNGVVYRRGQVARVPAGRVQIIVGSVSMWISVQRPCRIRSTPELGCYP